MESNLRNIQPGTRVYSSDDEHVGDVEQVGPNYLLTRKGWFFVKQRYVPFSAVSRVEVDSVYLNIANAQVDKMDWDAAPPAETAATLDAAAPQPTPAAERRQSAPAAVAGGGASAAPLDASAAASGSRQRAVVDEPGIFQEQTWEVRAKHEQLVVGKRAHVVEEIVLRTNVVERVETFQDTVRRTRVELDELRGGSTVAGTSSVDTSSTIADSGSGVDTSIVPLDENESESNASTSGPRRGRRRLR